MKRIYFFLIAMICVVMVACGSQNEDSAEQAALSPTATTEMMADDHSDEAMADDHSDEAMADDHSDEAMADDHSDEAMADDHSDEAMADDHSEEAMADDHSDETMADDHSDDDMMAEEAQMNLPAWQTVALVNAQTGESFSLADFAGKTVYVEPMATWCGNCRQQLGNVQAAKDQLNREDIVFVAVSVETTISNEELAKYAEAQGFDFVWAVLTAESLQAFVGQCGITASICRTIWANIRQSPLDPSLYP